MKQLKFMLAAATAIGLATASQAAEQTSKLVDNENFDGATFVADTAATNYPGYSYAGETPADNESIIKAGGYDGSANALQVNTGTDPLLRALSQTSSTAQALNLADYKSVYIDTMVQFTVTPAGDTVEAGEDDKLMIYLAEVTNETGVVTGTNLMVKAAQYTKSGQRPPYTETFTETDVEISNAEVVAGTWYNLRVTSYVENGITLFTIKLGDNELVSSTALYTDDAKKIFPALTGKDDATLTYVGFAGEGLVDNLTVATVKEVTSVDFSFTWSDEKISAVTYTIGGVTGQAVTKGAAITGYEPGTMVTLTVTPATWYKLASADAITYTVPAAVGEPQSLDAYVTAAASADESGNVTVTEGTTAADLGITAGAFAAEGTTAAELSKALTWAKKVSGKASTSADASSVVAGLAFATEEETQAEKAYLLNVADNAEAVADAIAAFKFDAFDPLDPPEADDFASKGYNGTVTIKGATAVDGVWGDADATSKFFKAVLTK